MIALSFLAIVIGFGIHVLWDFNAKQSDGPGTEVVVKENEMKAFFSVHIEPIVQRLENGQYEIKEVQDKYDFLIHQLGKMFYGREIKKHISPTYFKQSSDVYSYSMISENGDPVWGLIAPAIMDKAMQIEGSLWDTKSETFEMFVVVHVIHELNKLLYLRDEERSAENEYIIESCVWAEICDEIVLPLVEKHGVEFDDQTFNWYSGWKDAGYEKNKHWMKFVQDQFQSIK